MTKENNIRPLFDEDTQPLDLTEFRNQKKTEIKPYTVKDDKTVNNRRKFVKGLNSKLAFPTEVYSTPEAVYTARKLRGEGFGFIVPYSHADRRSPVDAMTTLISLGEGFEDAEYLGPIALHQEKSYIDFISKNTDIPLVPIITKGSVEYYKNKKEKKSGPLKRAGEIFKKRSLPTDEELKVGKGIIEYTERASDVLAKDKGIVFVAPQGGRRSELGEPAGRAVELIVRAAERKGAEKIAIWPMGILQQNSEEIKTGLNMGKLVNVVYDKPLTLEELREKALEANVNLDQLVFRELGNVLPSYYVNPKKDTDSS